MKAPRNARRHTSGEISVPEMALREGITQKAFRDALRDAHLPWHRKGQSWTVLRDSPEHHAMEGVMAELLKKHPAG